MSDAVVMVLTALIALGTLGWAVWAIWHIARHTPTRQRAATHVVGITAGTTLLGVVLPAALMGMVDPFLVWLIYPVLTVVATVVLGWRWTVLESGGGRHPGLVIALFVLLVVVAMAGFAVT